MKRSDELRWGGVAVGRVLLLAVCMCGLLSAGVVGAQAAENNGVPTLRTFTNLVQVPTLVLSQDGKPVAAIDERRFYISLDSGPKFRVTHARLEGDDALSVAILLDLSQSDAKILAGADEAIERLAPLSLHTKDEVFIYAMDCKVVHVTGDGASDAATLKHNVRMVLDGSQPRHPRGSNGKCENPVNLWDSLVGLVQMLSTHTGRKVILAVTDGMDRGSHNTANELMQFAQVKSVAIFGLVDSMDLMFSARAQKEQPFRQVCESSGGTVLETAAKELSKRLAWAITLVRARYILEFPRPRSSEGGMHNLDVTITKSDALIHAAGASFPTFDPSILKDPAVIQSDPTREPQLGSRRIVPKK